MLPHVDPVLAFSTLACPEWTPDEVIERGAAMGFQAVEWRGGPSGHVNVDTPPSRIALLRRRMADHGIRPLAVTTYGSLVAERPAERRREEGSLRAELDLAADLGAACVRVFVGVPEQPTAEHELRARAVEALLRVTDHAAAVSVDIALEPHDLHARAAAIRPILEGVGHPRVGVIWEIAEAWAAGEDPDDGLAKLAPWFRYVQVRDAVGGSAPRSCPLGEGEVPLGRAMSRLVLRGSPPPISVEWPRAWEPDLDPADVALPAAHAWVRSVLASAVVASAEA